MLEEMHVAASDGNLVTSGSAIILDGDGEVSRSEKGTKGNNLDDSAVGHSDGKELRAGRAVAVNDGGNSADAESSSQQGNHDGLQR